MEQTFRLDHLMRVMTRQHILVIEDEAEIAGYLRRGLTMEGYQVVTAYTGLEGLAAAREQTPDLVLLDVMLPELDGFAVAERLRAALDVPIIMLTARGEIADRVAGLEHGADDYLVKPFAFEELLARVRAHLRRRQPGVAASLLRAGPLSMNLASHEVFQDARRLELTAKEFELLECFMRHPNQVLTRDQIYDRVWGYDFGGESNVLEVFVRSLRQKLEAAGEARLLHTIRNVGYVLREQPPSAPDNGSR
jgi:two-component system, OmpR family, response regulator MprA